MPREQPAPRVSERAFTLLEMMVVVGIVVLLGITTAVTLVRAQAPLSTTRSAFASMLAQTEVLAQTTAGDRSGAVLVVTPNGAGSQLRVLAGRPITGFGAPASANIAPVATVARITLGPQQSADASIAVAPSGHIDFISSAVDAGAAPIENAPGCGATTTLTVTYTGGGQTENYLLDCTTGALSASAAPH